MKRDHQEVKDIGAWTILRSILERLRGVIWNGLIWIKGPVNASCEHGNKPSGSIECWEVLEYLDNWQPLKKGPAQWS
jgi:hypothetical protein